MRARDPGLAVVNREVQMDKPGTYRLDVSPEPVHGSFWIESNASVKAAVKLRDVEAPLHTEGGMRSGKKVAMHFRNDKIGQVAGWSRPRMPTRNHPAQASAGADDGQGREVAIISGIRDLSC